MGKSRADSNTLGLVGDGDDLDVIRAVEEAFGLTFGRDELADVLTMGDLHQVLVKKLNATTSPRSVCLSSVAFYLLRRALQACGIKEKITPSSDIAALTDSLRDPALRMALERKCGLKLPELVLTHRACAIILSVFLGGIVLAIISKQPLIAMAALLALIPLSRVLPLQLAKEHASMRNFVNACLAKNYAQLSLSYGQVHAGDVWASLEIIAKGTTGYAGEIDPATRLI